MPRTLGQRMVYLSQACDSFVFRRFRVLGHLIHDYRWQLLIIPVVLLLPMIGGMSQVTKLYEDDPSELYVPENTKADQDEAKIKASFGLSDSGAFVFGVGNPDGSNMLTTERVLTLYDAWDNVTAINSTFEGDVFNVTGVCVKLNGVCQKSTILAFYNYNRTLIAESSDAQLWQTLVNANFTAVEQDGRQINLTDVAIFDTASESVQSTRFHIVLEQLVQDDVDSDSNSDKAARWALDLSSLIWGRTWGSLRLYSDSFYELDREAEAPFADDLAVLPIGYFLLVMYATMVLSRNSLVHTHGSLASASFLAVCIATLAAFGLGLWFEIPFSNVILTLAFLLLGLGTDDTFVLVAAFQHPDVVKLEPRERVAEAMARAGTSITVTSLTDLIAFLAGSYSSIPVVKAFCQYAAIGVTLDFFLQVTFFSVVMYLSGEREAYGRMDWVAVKAKEPEAKIVGKGDFDKEQPEMMTIFLGQLYAPRLLTVPGKIIALCLGAMLFGVGIWACTEVTMDFEYEWFVADDSYYQETLNVRAKYWGSLEIPVTIYTFPGNYSSEITQVQYSQMTTALENNDMLVAGSCINWWPDFISFAETNATASMRTVDGQRIVSSSAFDATLLNFYNSDAGGFYQHLLTLSNDVLELTEVSCRDDGEHNDMPYRTRQMDRNREIAEICWSVGAVAFGPAYWVQDAHKIFLREIVINLACALAGVFVITTLMLGSLVPSLIVTFLLVVIDVEVLGSIYLSGDYFNTVTGINLVLAVGLSVDAVAHITHSFLAHDGTGNERAQTALTEIGRSVFNGAISTMIVLIPLVNAKTYVFQVFFRTFMAIIGYSAFNGLVVLPVLLSLFKPSSYNSLRSSIGIDPIVRNEEELSLDGEAKPSQFGEKEVALTSVSTMDVAHM